MFNFDVVVGSRKTEPSGRLQRAATSGIQLCDQFFQIDLHHNGSFGGDRFQRVGFPSSTYTASSTSRGNGSCTNQVFQPRWAGSAPESPRKQPGTSSRLRTTCTSKSNSGPT